MLENQKKSKNSRKHGRFDDKAFYILIALFIAGYTNKEISEVLKLSVQTVRMHTKRLRYSITHECDKEYDPIINLKNIVSIRNTLAAELFYEMYLNLKNLDKFHKSSINYITSCINDCPATNLKKVCLEKEFLNETIDIPIPYISYEQTYSQILMKKNTPIIQYPIFGFRKIDNFSEEPKYKEQCRQCPLYNIDGNSHKIIIENLATNYPFYWELRHYLSKHKIRTDYYEHYTTALFQSVLRCLIFLTYNVTRRKGYSIDEHNAHVLTQVSATYELVVRMARTCYKRHFS